MKFDYIKPASLNQLVQELSQAKSSGSILAGGTDLLVKLREGIISYQVLFDVNDIADLCGIEDHPDFIRIRPCTRMRDVSESDVIRRFAPFLSSAAMQLGSPQIRNRATIGGNIVSASPAADTVPPLMASGAKVQLLSTGGSRACSLEDFLQGPGKTDMHEGEVLTAIDIPKFDPEVHRSSFFKVGRRGAMTISVINLAGWVEKKKDGIIHDVKIVLGAVAPTAIRAMATEEFLRGKPCTEETFHEAAKLANSECRPIDDIRGSESGRRLLVEAWTYKLLQTICA